MWANAQRDGRPDK